MPGDGQELRQNDSNAGTPCSRTDYIRKSVRAVVGFVTRNQQRILLIAAALLLVRFTTQMLVDVEYTGQDVSVRGLKIFDWAKAFFPGSYKPLTDSPPETGVVPFPDGRAGIDGRYVIQGAVYDCRFLAAVASLACTEKGKDAIVEMITCNEDGNFKVRFPGCAGKPITVAPLTANEVRLYAHLRSRFSGKDKGLWLAVLEKAYGQYRIDHQTPEERFWRCLKHGIFEGRFTSVPILVGFGAAFGSQDDQAVEVLTSRPYRKLNTSGWELGSFGLGKGYVSLRQIRSWFNRDLVAREFEAEQHEALCATMASGGIATAGTEISPDAVEHGLMSNHAYSVLAYDPVKGRLLISDPMGLSDFIVPETGQVRDGVEDGIFEVTLAEFNRCFSHLQVQ